MAFQKGKPRTGGRQKGTPNKNTLAAKEAFQIAFDDMGGASALAKWAQENQSDFYKLYSRLIPMDTNISGSITLASLVEESMRNGSL